MVFVQLFLDWDGTLTKHDTILPLSKIGYQINEKKGITTQPWDEIVKAYLDDLKAFHSRPESRKESRTTIEQESQYLASLKPLELASTNRVVEAGVFANVTDSELAAGAEDVMKSGAVEMRSVWEKLFNVSQDAGTKNLFTNSLEVHIITVNWSATFISECIRHAAQAQIIDKTFLDSVQIYGNEVNASIGMWHNERPIMNDHEAIHTSDDKLNALKAAIEEGKDKASQDEQKYVSVYVGDTCTDFNCLLNADVGICIRDEPLRGGQQELADTFARIGVEVSPLKDILLPRKRSGGVQQQVYWTKDLSEIASSVGRLAGT